MNELTPWEICVLIVGGLLGLATAINTLGSAIEKLGKVRKAAKAPNEAQNDRLDDLEAWRKEMERANIPARLDDLETWRTEAKDMLVNDKKELTAIHDGMKVSHLAQLALLDHALNGNNITQMQDAKDALQSYLANK